MTLQDLIRRFRVLANDKAVPYFWEDAEVKDWLNDAQAQAAVRGRLLREDADPAVCRIALQAGQSTYALHEAVFELISVRLVLASGDRPRAVELVSREWLDAHMADWRECVDPVRFAIQDDTQLRLVGGFEAGDALALDCYRLPLKAMTELADKPELHQAHHEHLILWPLHKGFGIPDTEAFDPKRSDSAEAGFTAYFGPMPDSDLRRMTRQDVVHHNVAILA
jgi:hypothetical protein